MTDCDHGSPPGACPVRDCDHHVPIAREAPTGDFGPEFEAQWRGRCGICDEWYPEGELLRMSEGTAVHSRHADKRDPHG